MNDHVFELKIIANNDSFLSQCEVDKDGNFILDPHAYEVRRIIKDVSNRLYNGYTQGVVLDSNGNACGQWKYE